jgi:hypothetical protein
VICVPSIFTGTAAQCNFPDHTLTNGNVETSSALTTAQLNPCELYNITHVGDYIYGLYNTTTGLSTGGFDGIYPVPSQSPQYAIDNNVTTKYVNFGSGGCIGCPPALYGVNTGFFIVPSSGSVTVARGLRFATGDDAPNRDPITVTLEGSNATDNASLQMGSSWTLIYSGPTGINPLVDPGRETYGIQQMFNNSKTFVSYRLLVTSQRGPDIACQYSEVEILGKYDFSVNICIYLIFAL